MRARNTLLAAVLLAVLGGVIYLEYRVETGGESGDAAGRKLFDVDAGEPGSLSGIDLVRREGTISLRLREKDWFLTVPLDTPADNDEVSGLVATLARLEVTGRLGAEAAGSGLSGYGLEPPVLEVVLHGAHTGRLVVGDETPVGSGRYARADGQEGILTISSSVSRLLEAKVDSLRYSKIVGLDSWKIASLEVERNGVSSSLTRAEGAWRITSPIDFPADGAKVSNLLQGISALGADGFAPPGETLEGLGVGRPRVVLRIRTEEEQQREIRFGAAGAPGGVWAARSDMPVIFHLAEGKLQALEFDFDSLRDSRVAPLDRYGISEIRAEDPAGSKLLFKDAESNWRWGSADGPVISSGAVEDLLDALDAARAAAWTPARADASDPAGSGPRRRLRVTEGSREPVEVEIGAEEAGRIAVRTTASRFLYHVEAPLVRRLEEAVDAVQAPAPAAAAEDESDTKGESPS